MKNHFSLIFLFYAIYLTLCNCQEFQKPNSVAPRPQWNVRRSGTSTGFNKTEKRETENEKTEPSEKPSDENQNRPVQVTRPTVSPWRKPTGGWTSARKRPIKSESNSSSSRSTQEEKSTTEVKNEDSGSRIQSLTGIPRVIAAFGLKLFRSLEQTNPSENQIYSPIGIANAFSILMFGASRNSLLEVFHGLRLNESFSTPEDAHEAFKSFFKTAKTVNLNKDYSFDIANLILTQKNFTAVRAFVDNLLKYYELGFGEVDFVREADKVLNDVNTWIAKNTHNKITEFLKAPLDPLTKLVILNAVYFNGSWVESFDPTLTHPSTFYNFGTTAAEVPFMSNTGTYGFYENTEKKFTLLEMPYKGDVSFVIVMPTEKDGLPALSKSLTGRDIFQKLEHKTVQISIPKFKLNAKYDLKKVLPQLGIKAIFTPGADLSGISGDRNLFVSSAIHQSMIEIDERGTVASAITDVNIGSRSTRTQVVNVNRPFIFYIRNTKNKLIYFMGRVNAL